MGMPWKLSCFEKKSCSGGAMVVMGRLLESGKSLARVCRHNPKTQIPNPKMGLFHAPFMNTGGEAFGQLDFETQGGGFDWIEGGAIVFVLFATEAAGIGNRFPIIL